MDKRLALCLQQLKEVEAKLLALERSSCNEEARVSEALSFIQMAAAVVSEARVPVTDLLKSSALNKAKRRAGAA